MNVKRRQGMGKVLVGAIVVVVVAVAGLIVFMVASGTAAPNASACGASAPSGELVQVSIYKGSASPSDPPGYAPDKITVVMGVNNTVEWTNNDSIHHTVTTTSAPSGGGFNSGNMNQGATCTHTFGVPGTYQYDCIYHSWMTGTIVVKAS